jgi:hypothetical protein
MAEKPLRKRGTAFSSEEDCQLCRSWLHISQDATTGTDQTRQNFWRSIHANAISHLPAISKRTEEALRQRFCGLSASVQKFVGCVAAVDRLQESGKTAEDRMQDAENLFKSENIGNKPFKNKEVWMILKDAPKWRASLLATMSARSATTAIQHKRSTSPIIMHEEDGM